MDLLIEDLDCLENAVDVGDLIVCGDILALCVLDDCIGRNVRGLARLALDAGDLDGIDLVAGRETFDGVLIAGYGGDALGAAGGDGQRTLRDRQHAVCLDDELNVLEACVGVLELIGLETHLVGSGVYAACERLAAEGEVLLGVARVADLHGVVLDAVLGALIHDAVAVARDLDRDLVGYRRIHRGDIGALFDGERAGIVSDGVVALCFSTGRGDRISSGSLALFAAYGVAYRIVIDSSGDS